MLLLRQRPQRGFWTLKLVICNEAAAAAVVAEESERQQQQHSKSSTVVVVVAVANTVSLVTASHQPRAI